MIYEYRAYEVLPGRLAAMHARFRHHTLPLFARHGITVVGFWEAVVGQSGVVHYLLSFENLAHRERAWAAFQADPEWHRARDESHRDGWIVARVRNEIWQPTPYSPLQ
jgi:hypothetical protein